MKANKEYGSYPQAGEVRFVRLLPGPIERVWEFLTVPEKRALWFANGTASSLVGGKMKLEFHNSTLTPTPETVPDKYEEHARDGVGFEATILRFEPPHLLSHTFGGDPEGQSEVTYELSEVGDRVQLILTHRKAHDPETLLCVSAGWHIHLTVLVAKLEGSVQPPFWSTLMELEEEYSVRMAENS